MRRHTYSLSRRHMTTASMGYLYPLACYEVLPGDTFRSAARAFCRANALVAPLLSRLKMSVDHWYVPNRITFPEWEKFITGADRGVNLPLVNAITESDDSLLTRMGAKQEAGKKYMALPILAYNAIWSEHYRDRDIQDELDYTASSGDVIQTNDDRYAIRKVNWSKDYFTSARTEAQQGSAVSLALGSGKLKGMAMLASNARSNASAYTSEKAKAFSSKTSYSFSGETEQWPHGWHQLTSDDSGTSLRIKAAGNTAAHGVDVGMETNPIDIRDLRLAFAQQRFAEARARWGERYEDYLMYLGVKPMDSRLQHPEHLGGGSANMTFSEVVATDYGDDGANLGKFGGHGVGVLSHRPYKAFFPEHGYIISVFTLRPKAIYMHGVDRTFLRRSHEDYWQKELEGIGPQAVHTRELWADASDGSQFGYAPRYQEYRESRDWVSGAFLGSTYDDWHLGRNFSGEPTLNSSFLECNPDSRIFQDAGAPQFLVDAALQTRAGRLVGREQR